MTESFRRKREHNGSTIIRHKDKGALHSLLLRACPPDRYGNKSITILAKKLKLSPWALHKWCNTGRIPPLRARKIVDIADPTAELTLNSFSPFIFN